MAITQNTYTGNGSTVLFSFTFPYLETTDIKVSVNGTVTTAYTLANATTVQFNTAPANGASIRIYRDTDDSGLTATFYPGSAIRSQDLNDNFTQNLYVTQEVNNNAVSIDGSNPMVGDFNMNGYKVTNLAAPVAGTDAANRSFVEGVFSSEVPVFYRRWSKTAVGGETSLSGNDNSGIALSYVPGSEKVFINGALQIRGVDYLGTTGSTLTGIPALTAGDIIEVHSSSSYTVGTVPDGSVTNAKVDGAAAIQSTKLAFIQNGTGAVTRTVESKLRDVVSVKDFGAVGDGVTDDTAAIQAAVTKLITITNSQPATLYFPSGSYKVTNSIDFSASGGNRMEIVGGGGSFEAVTILAAYQGHGASITNSRGVFYFSAPTGSPSGTYSRGFAVSGFQFRRITTTFRTPPALEMIGAAQSRLNNITIGSWSGTAIRMDTPQNVRCINVTTFSGGKSFPYKDASAVTVTQSGTTLTASGSVFSASDVNKWIGIWGTGSNTYRRKAKVAAFVSATEVTLDQSQTDATARRVLFGSPFASVTNGSATLTADGACFTSDDVGLYLWIRSNVATNSVFRAKIAAFVDSQTVTLDTAAPFTDGTCEIAVAAFEIFSSGPLGDSSDNKFINLQVENHAGLGIGVYDASVLEFYGAKVHSEQSATVSRYSVSTLWAHKIDGIFSGSLDAQYLGTYRFWISAQTASFHLADVISRTALDEKLVGIAAKNTDYDGGVLLIDNLSVLGARPAHGVKDLIVDQNTATPGYLISGSFVNTGDANNYRTAGHLTNDVYALDNGSYSTLFIEATNKTYSLNSAGGSGFNRFTVRDETGGVDRIYLYATGAFGPAANGTQDLALTGTRWKDAYINSVYVGTGSARLLSGTGSPEAVVSAAVGSIYLRTDGGTGTAVYFKELGGGGNTGWVAK
jgi:hypothetical protein